MKYSKKATKLRRVLCWVLKKDILSNFSLMLTEEMGQLGNVGEEGNFCCTFIRRERRALKNFSYFCTPEILSRRPLYVPIMQNSRPQSFQLPKKLASSPLNRAYPSAFIPSEISQIGGKFSQVRICVTEDANKWLNTSVM